MGSLEFSTLIYCANRSADEARLVWSGIFIGVAVNNGGGVMTLCHTA